MEDIVFYKFRDILSSLQPPCSCALWNMWFERIPYFILSYTKPCSHPLPFTPIQSHPLPSTHTNSHLLPPTLANSQSFVANCHLFLLFLAHSHSFSVHSYPLPLMFSPLLLNLSSLPPMYSLSYPFPVHIQILSPNTTHHPPFQPIFRRAYVLYVPVHLRAFVFHVPMCPYNSFLFTLLPMSVYFTCLSVC